jgi:predicted PurR-regulated permease PerM
VRWIAAMAATAIALYLCWLMLKPFVVILEWATVLVIVFYPVHQRLRDKIHRRGLSAIISCLLVIVVVVVPLTFLIVTLAQRLWCRHDCVDTRSFARHRVLDS